MITDKLGNKIEVGDLVEIQYGTALLRGRIYRLKPPALVVPGGQRIKPGAQIQQRLIPGELRMTIDFCLNINDDSGSGQCHEVSLLVDPRPEEKELFIKQLGGDPPEEKSRIVMN